MRGAAGSQDGESKHLDWGMFWNSEFPGGVLKRNSLQGPVNIGQSLWKERPSPPLDERPDGFQLQESVGTSPPTAKHLREIFALQRAIGGSVS